MTDHPDTDLTDHHGEAEALRRENERLRRNDAILHDTIEKLLSEGAKQIARAEAAEAALARIAGGNLGNAPWQANYARIREVAASALAANRAPDPVVNAGSCQTGDLISREAALSAVKRECNAWDRNGTRAAQQMAGCLAVVIRALPAAPVAETQPDWKALAERLGELLARVPSSINSAFRAGIEETDGGSVRRQAKLLEPVDKLRDEARAALSDLAKMKGE